MILEENLKRVRAFSADKLRKELTNRELSIKGIIPTLRSRLLRFELARLTEKEPTPEISDATEDEVNEEDEAVGGIPV